MTNLKYFMFYLASVGVIVCGQGIIPGTSNRCFDPPVKGICRAYIPSFFYNTKTKACDCFVYGGCLGNDNRFNTLDDCLRTCNVLPGLQKNTAECDKILGSLNPLAKKEVLDAIKNLLRPTQTQQPLLPTLQSVPQTLQPVSQTLQPVPQTLQPVPQTLQPVLQTLQPLPQVLQPVPQTLQPALQTLQPVPQTLQPVPQTLQVVPQTLQPVSQTLQPVPQTLQSVPQTLQPVSQTLQPVPQTLQSVPQTQQPVPLTKQPFPLTLQSQLQGERVPAAGSAGRGESGSRRIQSQVIGASGFSVGSLYVGQPAFVTSQSDLDDD